ncbi:hypothetical protein HIM_01949 [Hirsutella minnesotensis 3608]|nr:hypothetical protein HIM_01949 [Hirsutella minnesotensis 3608]
MVTGIRPWTSFGDLNWRLEPRFACLWRPGGEAAGEQSHGKAVGDLLRTSLKDCPEKTRVEMLIKVLKGRISQMLGVAGAQIDQEKSPSAYGVDSLVAVELRAWLGLNVASKVSVFDITQSASLRKLAEKLNERFVQDP